MSRIGRAPISVPQGVEVKQAGSALEVKGPKGILSQHIPTGISLEIGDGVIHVKRKGDAKRARSLHGLMRTLIANMVTGVTQGFEKGLEIVGIGYRANVQGKNLQLSLGYSHPVLYAIPEGIELVVEKQNKITVKGTDKQKVGQVAAEIRSFRKPEPYKGKGIRYIGEQVRRKAGKAKA
ncbi:MAG: 50S ribosomal protein L6 [Deltaproteobacteria bacterium RBG_16_54_11]|jgi:large subunit ribosomal protein L6|nr:MAG: 50S ribosomal protein L6 [Deltaproteobacteria bacterium RBG_16_54_11]